MTPWTEKLLKPQKYYKNIDKERHSIFHTCVIKQMFLCKISRTDIDQGIIFISLRVEKKYEEDWKKLLRVMSFSKVTINGVLMMEAVVPII